LSKHGTNMSEASVHPCEVGIVLPMLRWGNWGTEWLNQRPCSRPETQLRSAHWRLWLTHAPPTRQHCLTEQAPCKRDSPTEVPPALQRLIRTTSKPPWGRTNGRWMWGGQDVVSKAFSSEVWIARLQTRLLHQWCSWDRQVLGLVAEVLPAVKTSEELPTKSKSLIFRSYPASLCWAELEPKWCCSHSTSQSRPIVRERCLNIRTCTTQLVTCPPAHSRPSGSAGRHSLAN